MLRLTLLLLVAMFVTALIGGRDYGQLRPGLLAAQQAAASAPVVAAAPAAKATLVQASFTPEPTDAPLVMPLVEAPVAAVVAEPAPGANVWYIDARNVNVRESPTTESAVLTKLGRGEAATILSLEGDEWARILIEGDGLEGYVALRFLTQTPPDN